MTEPDVFVRMVLEHPAEEGPRLVFADWLDERGDVRGPWLRFVSRVHELARLASEPATLPDTDEAHLAHRSASLARLDVAAMVRFTPAAPGQLFWDRLDDIRSRRAVAGAELLGCGLLSDRQRQSLLAEARAAADRWFFSAAGAAAETLCQNHESKAKSYLWGVGRGLRSEASDVGHFHLANAFHSRLRELLLKEPLPPPLPPEFLAAVGEPPPLYHWPDKRKPPG